MASTHQKTNKGFDFSKKYKVSVWASTVPYESIPDDYFEESFNAKKNRATNQWSQNYQMRFFNPELMETNGSQQGLVPIEKAAGECSFSSSFIQPLMSKARKKNLLEVSWLILLFDYEYSSKLSSVESDDVTTLIGAFSYDDEADSVIELEE